jgi:O-acetylhomoserine/O-acetylserine sulfhydrylase-like pyridoxal-dependent enzyme
MCRSEKKEFGIPIGILTIHSNENTGRVIVTDAIATPIVQIFTYTFKNTAELIAFQDGRHISYEYRCSGNSTTHVVEEKSICVFAQCLGRCTMSKCYLPETSGIKDLAPSCTATGKTTF